jgi:hypothetical protein
MQKSTLLNLTLFFFFTILGTTQSGAQVCNSELTIVNNRDSRSVSSNDPTVFQVEIKNNSSKAQSYVFSSTISDQKCDGPSSGKRSAATVDMNVLVRNNNQRSNSVSVAPGAKTTLQVEVSVGSNIQFNKWYCVELMAVSDLCSSKAISKNLKVYVSDGKDN